MELILIILLGFIGIKILPIYQNYRQSSYQVVSKNTFLKTILDKGIYGEFLTFSYLEELSFYKRLMTNLYIPKKDGSTTEIDLVMLTQTGIYVFESKNYSGWIFGDENSSYWMQTLKGGQKNRFFNPIIQNRGHIEALKAVLKLDDITLFKSYIVFSERCEFKKMNVASASVKVLKRNALLRTIQEVVEDSPDKLTIDEVNQLYFKLVKYAIVDEITKTAHIESINSYKKSQNNK
ncbi:MAG: nuclease-related domain-containing protein [Gudongella sp.]|jgi:hypothetical protein|nr:nuclease-related domain-containing protein [Gudongella sp.]